MFKRFTITKSILLSLLALVLVAMPVFAAYRAPFVITEDNGMAYDMFPAMVEADNEWMADNDFFDIDARDTRVETLGGQVKPHMVATDKTLTSVPVPADSQINLQFTTGNTSADMDIIAGHGGFITIPYAAGMDIGNNFEIELTDVWVNTDAGTGKYLVHEEQSFWLAVTDTEEITAAVLEDEEFYDTNDDIQVTINSNTNWESQTFLTTTAYTLDGVYLKLFRDAGAVLDVNISIRTTTAGVPDAVGGEIATGSINSSLLTVAAGGAWYFIDLTDVALANATTYAIVVEKTTEANNSYWRDDATAPAYGGGSRYFSVNAGVNWAVDANKDFMFRLWSALKVVAVAVPTDEHDILVTGTGGGTNLLAIDIDAGTYADNTSIVGTSAYVSTNDWILMDNTTVQFMPYFGIYEHTVGGALVTRFQPNDMIDNTGEAGTADAGTQTTLDDAILTQANDYWNGARLIIITTTDTFAPQGETSVVTDFDAANDRLTFATLTAVVDAGDTYTIDFGTLPDREAAANDARITWGADPAGIATSLGGMVSSSQPSPGVGEEDVTLDILPDIGVSDWFIEPDVGVGGSLLTNPFRPFVTILSDSTTLTELQAWRILGLAFVLFVTVATAAVVRSHLLIAGIAAGASIGACCALTIFPLWALVFVIGAVAGGLVAERSPSL